MELAVDTLSHEQMFVVQTVLSMWCKLSLAFHAYSKPPYTS